MSEYKEVQTIIQMVIKLKKKKDYEKALRILLDALEKYPKNKFLKTSLADLYTRLNRLVEAGELADQVLGIAADNYNALTVKGNIAFLKRNFEESAEYFEQAYHIKKNDYIATRLIRTYINLDKLEFALSICQEKIREEGSDKRFKKMEAEIYKKLKKYDKAEKIIDEYLIEEKDDDFLVKEKIQIKLKEKAPAESVRELKQLMKVDSYRQNIHLQALLAEKLQENEEFEEAVEVYQKALLLDPEERYIIKNMGMALYKKGRMEEALSYLKKAFSIDPNDYYIRSTLEYIYKNLKLEKEGIEFFQQIINTTGLNNLWGIIKRLAKEVEEDDENRGTN